MSGRNCIKHTLIANIITKCDNETDLGGIHDTKLIFDLHIQAASNKANQIIGIIRITFRSLNRCCFIKLYKAMVRPHLEYGNTIIGTRT